MKINYDKHIYEGWTVKDFCNELAPLIDLVMTGRSWKAPFKNKSELKTYCMENQPYYKKAIPEVINHFAAKYNIK